MDKPAEEERELCPSKIGPYQLRGTIGMGGFSIVKLAYRADYDRFYACKVIRRKRLRTDHELQAFESEIRILQQMRNPYLVALCDLFKDHLNYYLIMEFCPNGSLFNVIVKLKRIPEDRAKVFMKQLLLEIAYLHRNHIGHRDLKPENVMIDEHGGLKLTDFGLAKYSPPGELTNSSCGSPYYVSPEIISGVPYSPRQSDMWSIGVVLFAMVSGHVPWKSTNRQMIFDQIKRGEFDVPVWVSDSCADLICKLMVVDPKQRLTAAEALQHKWLASCGCGEAENGDTPLVSLRKVDDFFAPDHEDEERTNYAKENLSTSTLKTNYAKVMRKIIAKGTTPPPVAPPRLQQSCVCPSMRNFDPSWGADMLGTVPPATILSLLPELAIGVRKKGRKIVRPKVGQRPLTGP